MHIIWIYTYVAHNCLINNIQSQEFTQNEGDAGAHIIYRLTRLDCKVTSSQLFEWGKKTNEIKSIPRTI